MTRPIQTALCVSLLLSVAFLQGCGCGFDCNSDDDNGPLAFNLGFSDAPINDAKEVVLEIDAITFRRVGSEDVIVETFTIDALGLTDAESFQINLLEYQGANQLLVITGLELEAGQYSSILLTVLDRDVNASYVLQNDDIARELNVASTGLLLPGFNLSVDATAFTVEFSLNQSLLYNSDDTYELTDEGVRVESTDNSAILSGRVDSGLFDQLAPCDSKADPEQGNQLYLYQGINLDPVDLADIYTDASTTSVPANALRPYAAAPAIRGVTVPGFFYVFAYLPAGDYTLAFTCAAEDDDPVDYDGFVLPLPIGQLYEFSLDEAEQKACDLAVDTTCS